MIPSKSPARGAQVVLADASAACGLAASAPRRRANASGVNDTSASTKRASVPCARRRSAFHAIGFPARRVTSAATVRADAGGASPAPSGPSRAASASGTPAPRADARNASRGRPAAAPVRQTSTPRPRGAGARGVDAHLTLHRLGLAPTPEARRGARVRAVARPRRGHVDGAHPEARSAVAEVEVLAVEEVARVEAGELAEEVAPDRHEGAVHPVDAVGCAAD